MAADGWGRVRYVIFFFCPECKEELEAEDSIKGSRMKCPACFKELEVPQVGVKVTSRTVTRRSERAEAAAASSSASLPGARFILVVLVAGLLGALAISGIGWTLHKRTLAEAESRKPKCGACDGKGAVRCAVCNGGKTMPCAECTGTGRRRNFRDEEETCFRCSGGSRLNCRVCDGRGEYQCAGCGGTGRLAPAEPYPRR
jgi:DNA-directed RNA polymerase subunit M/transcription elongation factor TFIIS